MSTLLLTGATGGLGRELALRLAPSFDEVLATTRSGDKVAELRAWLAARRIDARITPIVWAPDRSGLGVSSEDHARLRRATHVLHCAADTRFNLPLDDARAANVEPTRGLLALARECSLLECFGALSTLYVAGTRTGTIMEADLEPTTWVNTYEKSKFESEELLRDAMPELPIVVLRVSTILGRASDGFVPGYTAMHRALRAYHRGLVPMIPGVAEEPLELLELDYASDALAMIFRETGTSGSTYQVVGGPEACITIEGFVGETHRLLEELDPAWAAKQVELPVIVPAETYRRFEQTVADTGDVSMMRTLSAMGTFLPQLTYPKRFDATQRDAAYPSPRPPHVGAYLARVLEHCLRTRWGREAQRVA